MIHGWKYFFFKKLLKMFLVNLPFHEKGSPIRLQFCQTALLDDLDPNQINENV